MKFFILNFILISSAHSLVYQLKTSYEGQHFFDTFNFFTDDDYTKGTVDYVNRSVADNLGLISFPNGKVKIAAESTKIYPNGTRGRPSVRIQSIERYNEGLFIFDFDHMPIGPGTWPSFWLWGENWPNNGELDILEGIDGSDFNSISGHTRQGCRMDPKDDQLFTGHWAPTKNGSIAVDCFSDPGSLTGIQGCSIRAQSGTFGPQFNDNNGGIYAMEWNRQNYARFWIFKRNDIPDDINKGTPTPDNWRKPVAYFRIGSNCSSDHFNNLTLTINLTFCGLWAGYFYPGGEKACEDVVRNQPKNFTEAYWLINYAKIYEVESPDNNAMQKTYLFLPLILSIFINKF